MIEKAFHGTRRYWLLLIMLGALIAAGIFFYLRQTAEGLSVTGMSRSVSWGLYIAQFTFFVGVAASAVTVVLPYYLHDYRAFGKITILGEFLAVSSVIMCLLFIFVDLGQPFRILHVILYPSPTSPMFWDTVVLFIYLVLNLVIGWTVLTAEYRGTPPPSWVKPLIILSIPWAISIHTVTAFLYAGLPGRHLWLSAITAARFLASAFSSGPALLIILCRVARRYTDFDPGEKPERALGLIITYAFSAHIFFILLEVFTAFYSGIPSHRASLERLFWGWSDPASLTPFLWTSMLLALIALALLYTPARCRDAGLLIASIAVFASVWIEKGLGFVVGGFNPDPLERLVEYRPTAPESLITLGVWATGLFILALLFKITAAVRRRASE
ncbi:MAG TPA: polysulfide reductase NrfD [Spirochaetota bacterium]|nr:polysulfide reductase NrfD [Spirochaetota bacterium]